MSVESIDSESIQLDGFERSTADLERKPTSAWNGRSVSITQIEQGVNVLRDAVFPSLSNRMQLLSTSLSEIEVITCGEKVDGEVSVSGSVDTEGNKSAEMEVEVSSKDGTISGSASGSISQDKDGNTSGEVRVGGTIRF